MIEETLTRIAIALEGILAEMKYRPQVGSGPTPAAVMPDETGPASAVVLAQNEEPPKAKKRGRPSKAEMEARAASISDDAIVAEADKALAAALPVEQPKCPDCGTVLNPENSSKSSQTGKLLHVGCKAGEKVPLVVGAEAKPAAPEQPVPALTIEKVREAALAFTKARDAREAGSGRAAFIAVLGEFGAKVLNDVPAAKWPELVAKLNEAV